MVVCLSPWEALNNADITDNDKNNCLILFNAGFSNGQENFFFFF